MTHAHAVPMLPYIPIKHKSSALITINNQQSTKNLHDSILPPFCTRLLSKASHICAQVSVGLGKCHLEILLSHEFVHATALEEGVVDQHLTVGCLSHHDTRGASLLVAKQPDHTETLARPVVCGIAVKLAAACFAFVKNLFDSLLFNRKTGVVRLVLERCVVIVHAAFSTSVICACGTWCGGARLAL